MKRCNLCKKTNILLKYPNNIMDGDYYYQITNPSFGRHGDIYKCQNCKLAFIDNDLQIRNLIDSYKTANIDYIYEKEFSGRVKTALKIIKNIKKYIPSGDLLDIGCNTGTFLLTAQQSGYKTFGLEPSDAAVKVAKRKGLNNIEINSVEKLDNIFIFHYFDIITLFDVIEHLINPARTIDLIYRKLKNNGIVVISTPDFSSLLSKILKNKWYAIQAHHTYYFSKNNLVNLLQNAGFAILETRTMTRYFSINYLITRLFSKKNNNFHKFLQSKLSKFLNIVLPINLADQLLILAIKR